MKTAIIDYEAGNLANAYRAAERAGLDCVVTRDPAVIRDADSLILPGVGAMKDAMDHLNAFGLTELLREEARNGKKLVGICLGMQAFCDTSEEGAASPGWDSSPAGSCGSRRAAQGAAHGLERARFPGKALDSAGASGASLCVFRTFLLQDAG